MRFLKFYLILFLTVASTAFSQKDRLVVLTYKFNEGDKYRVAVSTYKNFSTISSAYNNSIYGETAYDIHQNILHVDGEGSAQIANDIELTRYTINGQNLTYKMAKLFANDHVEIGVDRFGTLLEKSLTLKNGVLAESGIENIWRYMFIPFPEKTLKIGETWTLNDAAGDSAIILPFKKLLKITDPTLTVRYKLEEADKSTAKIKLSLEVNGEGVIPEHQEQSKINFLVIIEGTMVYSFSEGRILNGSLVTQLAGTGTVGSTAVEYSGSLNTTFTIEEAQ